MSGIKGTMNSRALLRAGVPQIPPLLEKQILAGVQEPCDEAQAAAAVAIEKAKQAMRARHLAEKQAQTTTGR